MNRRAVIRLLAAAAALPALPRELLALGHEVHSQLAPTTALRALNAHQNAMVTVMAELIIPATDTPGAKAARVNEFIDLMLAEWYPEKDRARFLAGLGDVDARSRVLFGKDFVDCAENQQVEILTALDAELARAREAIGPGSPGNREQSREAVVLGSPGYRGQRSKPEQNFFFMVKQLTLVGYYTSEIGAIQELHHVMIPSRYQGCVPIDDGTKASRR